MKHFFNRVFLAPDDGAPAGGGETTPPVTSTPAPAAPDPNAPKYNDAQLNDLITKGVAKELKKAGVKDLDELKGVIEKIKTPATPPADDPTKAELEELKKTVGSLTSRADENEATALALKSGVTDDKKLSRVVKLAMSAGYEGTIAERVAAVIAEAPEFVGTPGQPFGVQPKKEEQDVTQSVLDQALAHVGLGAKK